MMTPVNHQTHWLWGLFTGLLIFLTACSAARGKLAQLDQAEQQWREQKIEHYQLEVLVVRSIWHAQLHRITVDQGAVVDQTASCIPAPIEAGKCAVEPFNAEDFTIPQLFQLARAEMERDQGEWTKVEFDSTYGFPSHIGYNHPEIIDEDWGWQVKAFKILP